MRGRTVAFVLAAFLGASSLARAQDVPPPGEEPATSTIVEQPPAPPEPPPPPPPVAEPPVRTVVAGGGGHLRVIPSEAQITRWRRARIVSAFGTFTGVAGLGLSLSSSIYVAVTDYPPSADGVLGVSTARPTDVGPMLAYTGASLSTVSFILTAAGLGAEHSVLRRLGIDTDRGRFGAATALGTLGAVSTGLSYFFGATDHLSPRDQSIAILTTSITGTALCAIASILYLTDSSRMKKNWKTFTQF